MKYPDQQKYLIIPPTNDFKRLSVLRYRLVTKVVLSHVLWSGKSSGVCDGKTVIQYRDKTLHKYDTPISGLIINK